MTLPTFTPAVAPFAGTKSKPEVKLLKAEFGDGYTQSTRAGLNHIRQVHTLVWEKIKAPDAEAMIAFFEAQGGDLPFLYRLTSSSPLLKWTCEEWDQTFYSSGFRGVTATLRQSFVLAS